MPRDAFSWHIVSDARLPLDALATRQASHPARRLLVDLRDRLDVAHELRCVGLPPPEVIALLWRLINGGAALDIVFRAESAGLLAPRLRAVTQARAHIGRGDTSD